MEMRVIDGTWIQGRFSFGHTEQQCWGDAMPTARIFPAGMCTKWNKCASEYGTMDERLHDCKKPPEIGFNGLLHSKQAALV